MAFSTLAQNTIEHFLIGFGSTLSLIAAQGMLRIQSTLKSVFQLLCQVVLRSSTPIAISALTSMIATWILLRTTTLFSQSPTDSKL